MGYEVRLWIAAAALRERGQRLFTRQALYDEIMRLFPRFDQRALHSYLDEFLQPALNCPAVFFVAERGGNFRLATVADEVRWNQIRWPEREEVHQRYQPLWDVVMPLLQVAEPAQAPAAAAVLEAEADDPSVHFRRSSYRESMLEHLLIGELMRHLWPKRLLEVVRPQVDSAGYDLILQCDGVLRHVQLKSSTLEAKAASVNLQAELWQRQGACVIWTRFDPQTLRLTEFWWLGGPSQPLPPLEELEVAKHTKANAQGVKAPRPSVRMVPKGAFKRLGSIAELVEHLFG